MKRLQTKQSKGFTLLRLTFVNFKVNVFKAKRFKKKILLQHNQNAEGSLFFGVTYKMYMYNLLTLNYTIIKLKK